MKALSLFLFMLTLSPARNLAEMAFRYAIANAIVWVTDDEEEQKTLAKIGFYESGYSERVSRCEDLGYPGNASRGTFQTTGLTSYDRRASCGTLYQQAELAIRYVHRSANACPKNRGHMKLAVYVSGRCDRGEYKAKQRWGGD